MIDRFPGLRHDAVVGRHDQHDDVGDLGAAGAHHGERGVAGRVEEHDAACRFSPALHQVGADVLRDAAGFALGDAGLADRVEQRRLAVIDVAHDRDDRPARDHVLRIGGLVAFGDDFLLEAARLDLGAEARGERLRGFEIDRGVDGHHHAAIEQRLQRVLDANFEAIGEILHRHAFGEGDRARDRRRRGRRGRLLRTLQRVALLRRLQARRAMLLLRTEARPHRRLARTLRHARRRTHRLRRQRARPAQHRRGVALRRTRLAERTLALRAREVAGRGLRRTRRSRRHDARRLRHDLPLRLQRRRARRRLAGFFDAQANARRHEAAGAFRARLSAGSALARRGRAPTVGRRSASGASAHGSGAASTRRRFDGRRRRGASTGGARRSSGFGSAGFAFLIRRGGPSVGAAGFGGSGAGAAAPFLPGAAFAFARSWPA